MSCFASDVASRLTACCLLLCPLSAEAGVAVGGTDRVEGTLPLGVVVTDYENDGYRLTVDGRRVVVEVSTVPLDSSASFARLPGTEKSSPSAHDDVARLARALTAGSRTPFEAASRVLGWVSENLTYDLDRKASQEAEAVLQRRSAYCTGFARLTVGLLQAAGLEAREIPGLVLTEAETSAPRFHRWIEIRYPDVGWVFSDPLATHNYVPATYVPLASARVASPEARGGAVVRRQDAIVAIDLYPGAHPKVRARKNRATQQSGALQVTTGGRAGQARLEGGGQRRTLPLDGEAVTFTGVEPGRYHLLLRLADGIDVAGYIDFEDRERRRIDLPGILERPHKAANTGRRRVR